jgi:hypothetical protein
MRRIVGALILFVVAVFPRVDDISHRWIPVRRAERFPTSVSGDSASVSPGVTLISRDSTGGSPPARARRGRTRGEVPSDYRRNPLRFLSKAPTDSLVLLPGIGPVLAERIANARTGKRSFTRWDDLLGIKGIGPKTIERLKMLADGAKSH